MLKYETPELHFARCATVTYNVSQITYLVVQLCTSIFKSVFVEKCLKDALFTDVLILQLSLSFETKITM